MSKNNKVKKFTIESIDLDNIKFYCNGQELTDVRDIKPVEEKFNPDTPILELVRATCPSYEICNHPLITKYGYGTFGMACEMWYWNDNLSEASELELWKIFALIKASDSSKYQYWYDREVYEARKNKKERK